MKARSVEIKRPPTAVTTGDTPRYRVWTPADGTYWCHEVRIDGLRVVLPDNGDMSLTTTQLSEPTDAVEITKTTDAADDTETEVVEIRSVPDPN